MILTLTEATRPRTANPPEPKKSVSVSRPGPGATKAHARGNSFASSTMSRTGSTASRSTNGSFSATAGYGARPTSAMSRPNPSLGARKLNGPALVRPATSLDTNAEDGGSVLGKRKGTHTNFPYSPSRIFSCPTGSPEESHPSSRWIGLPQPAPIAGFEAAGACADLSKSALCGVTPGLACSLPPGNPWAFGPNHSTPVRPVKPSMFPIVTPSKSRQTPSLSPSRSPRKPPNPVFLTKDSSITSFDHHLDTEWDRERREKNMEEMFAAFMSQMNQQGQQSTGLKETVEIYKSRSK